ncbi:MAG: diacylglycerol/lipid kinase family protein [Limisphaerales bacterium]
MRPCVIFNPAARGERALRFRRFLAAVAPGTALKPTTGPGAGRELAAEAAREGYDVVVAAGGDGTLHEVVNGLADVPGALNSVTLGILPLGTVNVFALELGLPMSPPRAWEVIREGAVREVDLPWAEVATAGGLRRMRFISLAGAGLDARAVQLTSWGLKRRFGRLAYLFAAMQAWREPPHPFSWAAAGERGVATYAALGNGRFYGGRLEVFPGGDVCSGLVHACLFPRVTAPLIASSVWAYFARRPWHPPSEVRRLGAGEFGLTGDASVPVHLDGELVGALPARFGCDPGERLHVLAPGRRPAARV